MIYGAEMQRRVLSLFAAIRLRQLVTLWATAIRVCPVRATLALFLTGLSSVFTYASEQTLPPPMGEILLTVGGNIQYTNIDDVAAFDEALLESLPRYVLKTTTAVTDGVKRFDGFLMCDLFELVGAEGQTVMASALDDYVIDIPMQDIDSFNVLIATHMDGKRLLPSDKGPFWIVYPRDYYDELRDIRYDYRWVRQLIRLDVK